MNEKVTNINSVVGLGDLKLGDDEFRELIKKVVEKEGFEENFISEAKMRFQVRSRRGQNNMIKCTVLLKDKNGKLYSNKNPIEEQAYGTLF